MGLFSRWYDDDRLHDLRYLANTPINTMPPYGNTPQNEKEITTTIALRLAHLIFHLETRPCYGWSCMVAKWYLDNLKSICLSTQAALIITPLSERLRRGIQKYEMENNYTCDSTEFINLLNFCDGTDTKTILCGRVFYRSVVDGPRHGTPTRRLADIVNSYCWQEYQ